MLENVEANSCTRVNVDKGGAELLMGKSYNIIFANINKNVLLLDLQHYAKALKNNGIILLSGFYTSDNEDLISHGKNLGLILAEQRERNDWSLLRLVKQEA